MASTALLLLLALTTPEDWIRWLLVPPLPVPAEPATTPSDEWIRLIPAGQVRASESEAAPPVPTRFEPELTPENSPPDEPPPEPAHRVEWSFDPSTSFRLEAGTAVLLAPALPDTMLLHAEFLDALRLGNIRAAIAMIDTTQAAIARRQFRTIDDWVNRNRGPMWSAQGAARRKAAIWYRAVGEAEEEGHP